MNTGAVDKIYNYLSGEKEYVDLPETEQARKKVKAHAMAVFSVLMMRKPINSG